MIYQRHVKGPLSRVTDIFLIPRPQTSQPIHEIIVFIANALSMHGCLSRAATDPIFGLHLHLLPFVLSCNESSTKTLHSLKDKDYCLMEIIKGLTDKG